MKTAAEIKQARNDEWKKIHENFVNTTIDKYSDIFEKDLIGHSKTVIDLRKTSEESDYKYDWATVLHCICAGQLNIRELAEKFVEKFKGLGYKAYFDGSDAVVVEMP